MLDVWVRMICLTKLDWHPRENLKTQRLITILQASDFAELHRDGQIHSPALWVTISDGGKL